jgi:hypothetical protein
MRLSAFMGTPHEDDEDADYAGEGELLLRDTSSSSEGLMRR